MRRNAVLSIASEQGVAKEVKAQLDKIFPPLARVQGSQLENPRGKVIEMAG